jgi:hypothetical protein
VLAVCGTANDLALLSTASLFYRPYVALNANLSRPFFRKVRTSDFIYLFIFGEISHPGWRQKESGCNSKLFKFSKFGDFIFPENYK